MNPFATNKAKNSSKNKLDKAHKFHDWTGNNIHIKKHAPFWSSVNECVRAFVNNIIPDSGGFILLLACLLRSSWVAADNSQIVHFIGLSISSLAPCQLIALVGVLVIILCLLSGNWCDFWVLKSILAAFRITIFQNVKLVLTRKITTVSRSVCITKVFF
jgi:hypothetical protein